MDESLLDNSVCVEAGVDGKNSNGRLIVLASTELVVEANDTVSRTDPDHSLET